MKNNRVLVTAGSHSEIPLIKALHELGYYVITTGNNYDGWGHAEGDEYIRGDYSDREFVLNLARDKQVCGIVSGCNDFAYLSTAYACEKLGLSGHDDYYTACLIHQKDSFRKIQNNLGIKCPPSDICNNVEMANDIATKIGYPCMVKAVDLTGGKGVRKCNDKEELVVAVDEAFAWTRNDHIIIEKYVPGENHGFTCLLKNNKIVFSFLDDEQYYRNPYLVSGACGPSARTEVKERLIADIELMSSQLNLADGLFHVQIIIDQDGDPVMIDPCRRAPGDLYIKLVEYSAGIDYGMEIVKSELGMELAGRYDVEENYIARECIMAKREGIYKRLQIRDEISERMIDSMIWSRPGDNYANSLTYKAGILFMKFDTYQSMTDIVSRFHDLVQIEYYN